VTPAVIAERYALTTAWQAKLRSHCRKSEPISLKKARTRWCDDTEKRPGKIKAGADLVQIYTGLIYSGPALVKQAAAALKNMHK
jgi:hypothetical protein